MKKALLQLMMIPALLSAQGLEITAVSPSTLCPGDSIFITVKFITGNNTQINLNGISAGQIWQYNASFIKTNWVKSWNGTDSLYQLRAKTNTNIGMGMATISTINGTTTFSVDASCGTTTGIEEHALRGITPVYRDFQLNQVDKTPNTALIEYVPGLRPRKIVVQQ